MNAVVRAALAASCFAVSLPFRSGVVAQGPGPQPPAAAADASAAHAVGTLRLTTDRVVVFKDGHALFVKTARGTAAADGSVSMREVPDSAVLGSFWAACAAMPIRAMRAEWVEEESTREREVPCTTVRDLLVANAGRELVLTLQWPSERQLQCKVLRVVEADPPREALAAEPPSGAPAHAHLMGFRAVPGAHATATGVAPTAGTAVTAVTPLGGAWVELELPATTPGAEPQQAIVPVADVHSVAGTGLRTTCTRKERVQTTSKRLSFELGAEAAGKEVALSILYFTPGVRWIPTYRLTGELETGGELTLQAEILNELEDIDGAAVDLVVGVPNFRFAGTISPLALEQAMRNVLQQAAPQLMGQSNVVSNALFAQRAGEQLRPAPTAGAMAVASELASTGEHDMFVHSLPRLRLPRGARATVPLWASKPALRHLYTFDLRPVRDPGRGDAVLTAAGSPSPLELAKNDVWHQLELENGGTVPWTTGPALVMKGTLPLAQELLTYTPPGARTLLPLTVAVDVRGQYEERQTAMQARAVTWDGTSYARVTREGKVCVANYEQHVVEVRVRVSLGGKVLRADGDAAIALRAYDPADWRGAVHDARPNGHSDVTWTLRLEPNAERELSFEVEVLLR